jgi:hypothetical protein
MSKEHRWVFQRVERQNVAVPVVVEEHIHPRGPLEVGVKVDSIEALAGILTYQFSALLVIVQAAHT